MEKFTLGLTFTTQTVKQFFSPDFVKSCFLRHQQGDFGDICQHDTAINIENIDRKGRILSSYKNENGETLWIITDAGHGVTTALLPSEY